MLYGGKRLIGEIVMQKKEYKIIILLALTVLLVLSTVILEKPL